MLDKVFKTADKYPLLTFAAGTLGIMYLFEQYGSMNGLGNVYKASGTPTDDIFRKT